MTNNKSFKHFLWLNLPTGHTTSLLCLFFPCTISKQAWITGVWNIAIRRSSPQTDVTPAMRIIIISAIITTELIYQNNSIQRDDHHKRDVKRMKLCKNMGGSWFISWFLLWVDSGIFQRKLSFCPNIIIVYCCVNTRCPKEVSPQIQNKGIFHQKLPPKGNVFDKNDRPKYHHC